MNAAQRTMVVGAGRGLGRGVAVAFARAGAPVVAVARTASALTELAAQTPGIEPEVADATDPTVPGTLLDRYRPDILILVAGAAPLMRPLQHHTWESFSANWNADVRIAFHWLREALTTPMPPGGRVIVVSSGAAVNGSPLSGGYAGAKATQRFITGYARDEAHRAGLDIGFTAVLPQLTPATGLGLAAVRAYAERSGHTVEEYIERLGDPLTPAVAGDALFDLAATDLAEMAPSYLLTAKGLTVLP
ncbi:SDR family oxidoreductase [Nocardia veterana]|uniref:SDR family oxidoreductase n=1 Tax=Nocardia veterana TaxID=132249 RepID=A0A7X6RJ37_9NOCA|nr:SDR family oxidoreductase [Nocardia veterana]NKY87847.1 SDR family oxidoreductase [Nocardia veterana]